LGVQTRELTRAVVRKASGVALDCCIELAAEMLMSAVLVVPFQVVDRITHPLGTPTADARNVAVVAPCGTTTPEGTFNATLLAETPTVIAPAFLDSVTVQVLALPSVNDAGLQASDVRVGLDHKAAVTLLDEAPRVAVMAPDVSAVMLPAVAVKLIPLLPMATVTLTGTVSSGELELSVTGVFAATVCESVTVHGVVPADIRPVRLHVTDVTCIVEISEIDAD
jgi:hypothetical protein